MFCKKCGAPVLENEKFCGHCGARIEKEEAVEVIEEIKEEAVEVVEEIKEEAVETIEEVKEEAVETAAETVEEILPECVPVQQETPYQQPVFAPQTAVPEGVSVNATLWIILCALETVLCCSTLPGLFGLIFAIIAATKKGKGDWEAARSNIKAAKIAFWVGVALLVLGVILGFLFLLWGVTGVVSLAGEAISDPSMAEFFSQIA